jgi:hypothetical protein
MNGPNYISHSTGINPNLERWLAVEQALTLFKEWIEYSDAGMEWKADAQRSKVSFALPLAHFIMFHVLKTHNVTSS